MKMATKAIHSGVRYADPHFGSVVPPIYPSSTYVFPDSAEGARRFAGEEGMVYSRWTNPTVQSLEQRIAAIEGAEACIATCSGMSAITLPFLHMLKKGDHVLSHNVLYGATFGFIDKVLPKFGIESDCIDFKDLAAVEKHIRPETKIIYFETPTNPMMELVDMKAIAKIAKKHKIITIVDATFGPAVMQKPFDAGIDIAIHSLTKYMGGHSDLIAGAILGPKKLLKEMMGSFTIYGPTLSPFAAYLVMRGITTMELRIKQINRNAQKVADFLEKHPKIEKVYYPGLASHPQHELAKKQMPGGYGAVVSFEVKGGFKAAAQMANTIKVFSLAVSLGGVESLIQHPASMTHSKMSEKELLKSGIRPALIRISVGIEDSEDQLDALAEALERV